MSGITITFMTIWISSAIGCIFTKDARPFAFAMMTTIVVGFGYGISLG